MNDSERITRALNGRWHGYYGVAFCPAHNNMRTPALSLTDGDDGRILVKCHAGCDFFNILQSLKEMGLVDGKSDYPLVFPSADRLGFRAKRQPDPLTRESQARRLWKESRSIDGTIAETYLRSRGILCDLSDVLRFHPGCWHSPTKERLPALVAMIEGSEHFAIHRTFLQSNGYGKASVAPSKMMLGQVAGGAVRLTRSNGPLVVAEGIETALSLASGLLRAPSTVWAALSTSGIRGLCLPSQVGQLNIASDGDRPGREAAHALAERAHAQGWHVELLLAPDGCDWNDVVNMEGITR